jgi:GNAT superfamily N-acetyltransferase
MLNEMASLGGHPVTRAEEAWARLDRAVATQVQENDHLFLLAEKTGASRVTIGLAHASVVTREVVFDPTRVLHIHALYVEHDHRGQGIGRALLRATLEWGRTSECAEAELNVLVGNPALKLHEGLGFSASQMEMVREI